MRARIIHALLAAPQNTNQLADGLGVHYTTVAHHIGVLERNGLVRPAGPDYGKLWVPTVEMEEMSERFASIWKAIEKDVPAEERNL